MTTTRGELLAIVTELSELAPNLRMGQMLANPATLAQGTNVEVIWDADDEELLTAARRLREHYHERTPKLSEADSPSEIRTAEDFLQSDFVGLWADRTDLGDSQDFARRLREKAERREGGANAVRQ